jgi:hypothetical protein
MSAAHTLFPLGIVRAMERNLPFPAQNSLPPPRPPRLRVRPFSYFTLRRRVRSGLVSRPPSGVTDVSRTVLMKSPRAMERNLPFRGAPLLTLSPPASSAPPREISSSNMSKSLFSLREAPAPFAGISPQTAPVSSSLLTPRPPRFRVRHLSPLSLFFTSPRAIFLGLCTPFFPPKRFLHFPLDLSFPFFQYTNVGCSSSHHVIFKSGCKVLGKNFCIIDGDGVSPRFGNKGY